MSKFETIGYENTGEEILESFGYTILENDIIEEGLTLDYTSNLFSEFYLITDSNRFLFQNFLLQSFEENNKSKDHIIALEQHTNTGKIYFLDGSNLTFQLSDYKNFLINNLLEGETVLQVEKKVNDLQDAIESIYDDNDSIIFDGEIDENDRVNDGEYEGKTLLELHALLKPESQKLNNVYNILGETKKKTDFLRKEIELLGGIGDKYEGGARIFSLKEGDIQLKVEELIAGLSTEEIFLEIRQFNEKINGNWRKSDMVRQINAKVMSVLYQQTFDRLKKENRSNGDFIQFVEIITGRLKVEKKYTSQKDGYTTDLSENISFDNSMASYDVASKALLYIMYKKEGVFEKILQENKEIEIGDPEIEDKVPLNIVREAIKQIDTVNSTIENLGERTLVTSGFGELLSLGESMSYNDLNFDQKIALGAIYRIGNDIKDAGGNIDIESLQNNILKTAQEAFKALENDINDEFDGKTLNLYLAHPNFFGNNSSDFHLTGEMAQIFDLYQDIHGNSGFFDLHDANKDWFQEPGNVITLGVGVIAGVIILAGASAPGIVAMAILGAKIGLITGVTSLVSSRQGYDTYSEAALDSSLQLLYEIISSAAFMGLFGGFLKKAGALTPEGTLKFEWDIFFSKEAWSGPGMADKIFIFLEIFTGMLGNKEIIDFIQSKFKTNHFDSESTDYQTIAENTL
ncbi:hypothetical protein GW846_04830 [Candidatus Gracilibacteria bacterium]|nr:hypothetical protein [Candidatus Gracilibacteria bacterium]